MLYLSAIIGLILLACVQLTVP